MMDPINPWIDLGETRRLAERLMSPSSEAVTVPETTGFGDAFIGFSDLPSGSGFADPEPEVSEHVASSGQSESHKADTWEPLRAAIRNRFSPLAIFLVDASGELVFSEGGYDAFHFILRDLVESGGQPEQTRRLKVGAHAVLEVLPASSESGTCWLGVVLPHPPAPADMAQWISLLAMPR